MEELNKYFKDPEQTLRDIYDNGGTWVGGWGFLSGGYGGGIEQDQALRLLWVDGFISGIWTENKSRGAKIMKIINEEIIKMGIGDKNPPFREEVFSQYL